MGLNPREFLNPPRQRRFELLEWSILTPPVHVIGCHQMPYFTAKMHQIRFRLRLRPRRGWRSLQRFPRPPSWILWCLSLRGRGNRRGQGWGKGSDVNKATTLRPRPQPPRPRPGQGQGHIPEGQEHSHVFTAFIPDN